jgi:hypothetical protein
MILQAAICVKEIETTQTPFSLADNPIFQSLADKMGVPGLIGVLERMFGNDEWIKQQCSLKKLAQRANISGQKKIIAVDAMNFLFYLAGLKTTRGVKVELTEFCEMMAGAGLQALFVFDNTNLSEERKRRARVRKQQRKDALSKLQERDQMNAFEIVDKARKLEVLRTRTICVTPKEIAEARQVLCQSGVCTVLECADEADSVCADAVRNGIATWCLSNDSDMFVDGCPRILRMYDTATSTFDEWDTTRIFNTLRITKEEFGVRVKSQHGQRLTHGQMYEALGGALAG